jgi:hypothetical protein
MRRTPYGAPQGPRRSIFPERALKPWEVTGLVTIVALIVSCCLGVVGMSLFSPAPPPPYQTPVYPVPSAT